MNIMKKVQDLLQNIAPSLVVLNVCPEKFQSNSKMLVYLSFSVHRHDKNPRRRHQVAAISIRTRPKCVLKKLNISTEWLISSSM